MVNDIESLMNNVHPNAERIVKKCLQIQITLFNMIVAVRDERKELDEILDQETAPERGSW